MRILDRYIGREVASHAALGLAVFTFVFFVPQLVQLMELVVRHSGSFGSVAQLFLCTLPPVLIFTVPMSVLVGVLIGLGRLSSDSEIVALYASGLSLKRLLVPVGAVALFSGLATVAITCWLSPLSLRTLDGLKVEILASQAPFGVQPRVFDERFPHSVLYVQDVEAAATHWTGVFLASSGSKSNGTAVTVARDASVISGPGKGQLEIHLGAGSTHEYDPRYPDRYNVTTFGESDIPVDISAAASAPQSRQLTDAERTVPDLLSDHGPGWGAAQVELNNRFALPAACLVFALLGVPIGVRPRRGGRAAGMILTLILIGGYYFLWIAGDHFALQGAISPWVGIWTANIVCALAGLFFFGRVETVRKQNRVLARVDAFFARRRRRQAATAGNSAAVQEIPQNGVDFRQVANGRSRTGEAPAKARAQRTSRVSSTNGFPMLIDFYLLAQFFYYFLVLIAGFLLIFDTFTMFDLLRDISKNHIPFLVVVSYFRFLVPYMVYHLTPLATLVATLVTLAILAKNNEVIAFKASGISLYRLVLPLALAGLLLAGGMFLLDDKFLPYANQRQDALHNLIKGRPAQTYLQPTQQWIFGENNKIYNYALFDPARQLFGGLDVFELDPVTFQMRRRVYATRASWEPSENTWVLTGGWVRDFDANGRISRYYPFKAYSLPELTEPPSYFRREVLQSEQMNWSQLRDYIRSLSQAGFETARLSVEWHKKFAYPLMAAIIVCLGAPFALVIGTRGAVSGLAVAVAVSVAYWATAALFEAMGGIGQLPPVLAAWAPDLIFAFLALYSFLRMPT